MTSVILSTTMARTVSPLHQSFGSISPVSSSTRSTPVRFYSESAGTTTLASSPRLPTQHVVIMCTAALLPHHRIEVGRYAVALVDAGLDLAYSLAFWYFMTTNLMLASAFPTWPAEVLSMFMPTAHSK